MGDQNRERGLINNGEKRGSRHLIENCIHRVQRKDKKREGYCKIETKERARLEGGQTLPRRGGGFLEETTKRGEYAPKGKGFVKYEITPFQGVGPKMPKRKWSEAGDAQTGGAEGRKRNQTARLHHFPRPGVSKLPKSKTRNQKLKQA